MQIFNSQSKTKEPLETIDDKKVRIYSCGPTVYDDAHLGHARNAVVFDMLHRVLKALGYEVFIVKNYTDIDDKIINKAHKEGISIDKVSDFYIQRYQEDMETLGILPEDINPKATEYVASMVRDIKALVDGGKAYTLADGIYFDTSCDKDYGTVSNRLQDDGQHRIEPNVKKKNAQDFALWKFEDDESISYPSEFGRGRPGWHTECSAMIGEIFDNTKAYFVDIHCGGADLLFPHHENEATQVRCLYQNKEIARYWMHNGFVKIDDEKMSKSLGNSFFLKDVLREYHSEVVRFYLLSTHYRLDFNFTEQGLGEAKKFVDRLYRLKKELLIFSYEDEVFCDEPFGKDDDLLEALSDDLNISKALSFVNAFITEHNDLLGSATPKEKKRLKPQVASYLGFIADLLGVGSCDPFEYFQFGLSQEAISEIDILIKARDEARKDRDYQKADELKTTLMTTYNISIMDTPDGTLWERI